MLTTRFLEYKLKKTHKVWGGDNFLKKYLLFCYSLTPAFNDKNNLLNFFFYYLAFIIILQQDFSSLSIK